MSLKSDEDKLMEKLDEIRTSVASIDKNVALNTQSLITHMARTEANEQRIVYLERLFMGLTATSVLGGIIAIVLKLI
jgi:hypothetical protein